MKKNIDFEYYIILPSILGKTPLLMKDFSVEEGGIDYLYRVLPAPENQISYLKFSEPNPNPNLETDYFDLNSVSVFSKKVKEALDKLMPIHFYKLVTAIIKDDKGEDIKDFYISNIYQEIHCFDEKLSIYNGVTSKGRWRKIEKLVIDKEKLEAIPLEKRLVFISKEGSQYQLYHKSIVDIIKAINPKGLRFVNIENWHKGILFDFTEE